MVIAVSLKSRQFCSTRGLKKSKKSRNKTFLLFDAWGGRLGSFFLFRKLATDVLRERMPSCNTLFGPVFPPNTRFSLLSSVSPYRGWRDRYILRNARNVAWRECELFVRIGFSNRLTCRIAEIVDHVAVDYAWLLKYPEMSERRSKHWSALIPRFCFELAPFQEACPTESSFFLTRMEPWRGEHTSLICACS